MVRNRVTPHLLMLVLLGTGVWAAGGIKQEVFPEFDLGLVEVTVAYPGAGPEEVERGVVLPIEEALRGLDGVKEVRAIAAEGLGTVTVELLSDADEVRVYADIRQAVDRIRTFPTEAEKPEIAQVVRRRQVVSLQLYGEVDELVLRELAEEVRDRLLSNPGITQVDVEGARDLEVHVEVSERDLRQYGLTLEQVAALIRSASVELPAGRLETTAGEVVLRVTDRRDWAGQFARIPIVAVPGGGVVCLGDLAEVREGFADRPLVAATYDGRPSIGLSVYRVGSQTPTGVSDAVKSAMASVEPDLPDGVSWTVSSDASDVYRQRLNLLLRNALTGLVIVLLALGIFLELRLAFWVMLGIPTSFLGGLVLLSGMDVSINMISMFAFIISLGIVVDDAIVAGENIHEYRLRGMGRIEAAIRGARDVAGPVALSIITNMIAFVPLYFVPGVMGKIWRVIPLVVVSVFLISWVESLLILPSHLAHGGKDEGGPPGPFRRLRRRFDRGFAWVAERVVGSSVGAALRWRWPTAALAVGTVVAFYGFVGGGRIGMVMMPRVEADSAVATAVLPIGTPFGEVRAVERRLVEAVRRVAADNGGDDLLKGVFAVSQENTVTVQAYLTDPDVRPLSTSDVAQAWRREVGEVVGVDTLRFEFDRGGPGSGAALTIELSHRDMGVLEGAAERLAALLAEFPETRHIDDGFQPGKRQIDFRMRPEAAGLGLVSAELGRQLRGAFHGAEALRQQRERHEVKLLVRRPEAERRSEYDVESLLVSLPSGRRVPLAEVADVDRGRAYTAIQRRDGRRVVLVTADVEPMGHTRRVMDALDESALPELRRDFPGLRASYEGRQAEMQESVAALFRDFLIALVAIFAVLGMYFRNYLGPTLVMLSIPFGIVGAVLGHLLMGYDLSLLSMMGVVALSGVVVNDSILLLQYAREVRKAGRGAIEAIRESVVRRFRPVLLTTVTTFGGLAPMIFETSRQARFMIPMAISLGFGILFATVITLVILPCFYAIADDLARAWRLLATYGRAPGGVAAGEASVPGREGG
jgi:multidrug efflux pump subunit AcrB